MEEVMHKENLPDLYNIAWAVAWEGGTWSLDCVLWTGSGSLGRHKRRRRRRTEEEDSCRGSINMEAESSKKDEYQTYLVAPVIPFLCKYLARNWIIPEYIYIYTYAVDAKIIAEVTKVEDGSNSTEAPALSRFVVDEILPCQMQSDQERTSEMNLWYDLNLEGEKKIKEIWVRKELIGWRSLQSLTKDTTSWKS